METNKTYKFDHGSAILTVDSFSRFSIDLTCIFVHTAWFEIYQIEYKFIYRNICVNYNYIFGYLF